MSFLSPLALLLLGLSVPLLLLYFLKVRRHEQRVPSLLFWDPALRDREASTFFHRLQRDPLLLLQLLVLLALAAALARPVVTVQGRGAERTVMILDTSASMKATDVPRSRFAAAQREALGLLKRLPSGAEVMVIDAGVHPRVLAPFSRDREQIRSAVNRLAPRDFPNRLSEAIATARSLTARDRQAEIWVFTDGAGVRSSGGTLDGSGIRWVGVGGGSRNVGITHLAIRRTFYGAFGYEAFGSVVNFSEEPQSFTFTLELDGQPLSQQSLTLGPHVRRALLVPFSHQGAGVVQLRLDIADDFGVDNVAHAVIPRPGQIRVLLVSPENLFLEKALRADPQVELEVRTPDIYHGEMASFDVVVLDSILPDRIGAGRYVLINTLPPDVPLEQLGRLEQPVIMDWDRTHPIMRYVDFSKITIEEALRVRPLAAGKTLVEAVGGPLVYVLEEPRRKAVFFGFDLFKTDFPLRVAFPVMLSNSLRWLHPAGLDLTTFQLEAGQPILLPVEHGVSAARVITPSGRGVEAEVTRGLASFIETGQVGVYTLVTARGERQVAVNLTNAEESDITPRPLPRRAEDLLAEGPTVPLQRELWRLFVLLALVLLVIEGMLYWRRQTLGRTALPSGSDRWALGFRCVLVALLLVAVLRPTVPRWVDRLSVMFLLDVSDSVSLAAREHAYRFATDALQGMRPGDEAGLIVFGQEAVVDRPLSPRRELDRPESGVSGRGTDLSQALQLALATLPASHAKRVVLLTDGRQTIGSALVAAQAAKALAADVHYVPLSLTFEQEVVAESLVLPQEVKFGEPFDARVVAWSRRDTQGRLSLFRNGEFLGSQIIRLSAGKNAYTYRQSLEQSGIHVYQVAIESEGDTIEENNRAVATIVVRGRPQVLLAEKDQAHAQALRAAFRAQHIDVEVVKPEGIPKEPAGLQKYDALILSNISSLKLTKKQMEHIRDYVRDHGGGLVMVGGEESFGLGGYYRTPIEEALPVTMEVRQRIEIPSLAVSLSVDRSGSMAMSTDERVTKLDIAKEAAHLVVDLLDERNEVGVMSWDTEFVWDVPIQPAQHKSTIHHAVATMRAGGGTDGYPALKEAYRALFEREALLKHVIFLSDGQMTRGNFAGLVRRMAKDKITVSTVAIGKDSDVQLMFDIAKWGRGRFYYTEDTNTIPRIFTLETQLASKAALIEQPFRPVVSSASHEILEGIDWQGSPPLGGYVATTLKSTAEQLLMTHQEDPLLGTWRYGLGRTAAFTSDAKAKWAVLWLRWKAFNKFWGQLIRWTLRTRTRSDTVAIVKRHDRSGIVTVEAVDAKGEFINFLEAQVGVVTPSKQRSVVELEQVAPGRYRGQFPANQEGVYLVGMAQRRGESMVGSQLTGLVVPYAQEFRDLGVDETLLRELAELTGGGAVAQPRDVFLRDRRRSRLSVDLWPWLVGAVTMLLVPEIGLRRVGLGLFRRRSVRARGTREAGPLPRGGGDDVA